MYYLVAYGTYLLYILIGLIIFRIIFTSCIKNYHSNWNTLIDNFDFSTETFYKHFKKELLSHGISGITADSVSLFEGNIFSARRRYIRIIWKDYQYDICAAPFGDGFFISWWLLYNNSLGQLLVSKIPFAGGWLGRKLYPLTYYKIDTASMFMTFAQTSVLKVIDDITKEKGIRSLSGAQRKPILNDIFKR
tara:strand:- start:17350 stop:17922 length:573 start_codon:yes stop_codon:yes gene_type:complete